MEGCGVHGGQLQALRLAGASDDQYLGLFDEGVPALAEKAREIAARREPAGPARRLRRRPDDQRLRLLPRLLRCARAWSPTPSRSCFAPTRAPASWCARLETGAITDAEFNDGFGDLLGLEDRDADRGGPVRQHRPRRGDAGGGALCPRAGHPHRPDLELDGLGHLRPRRARGALRRHHDLRRRRAAQATAGDLPARRPSASDWPPSNACSSTTCARTASAPRRSA